MIKSWLAYNSCHAPSLKGKESMSGLSLVVKLLGLSAQVNASRPREPSLSQILRPTMMTKDSPKVPRRNHACYNTSMPL